MKKLLTVFLIVIMLITMSSCQGVLINQDIPFYSEWMSYIEDDILVKEIVIPGSHDAGTIGMIYAAKTQSLPIYKQLIDGVRYFDIRVEKKKNAELVIYHSIAKGQTFTRVVDDILEFMNNNTTEFVILDFQHFKNESMDDVAAVIETRLSEYLINNETDLTDLDFIDSMSLESARGKILICWGSDVCADRAWAFRRNNDSGTLEDTVMESYYDSAYHKLDSADFISNAYPDYYERYIKKDKGLFVLQGQLTAKWVLGSPLDREIEHRDNMNNFVRNLKDKEEWLSYTNIIMRDFVNVGWEKIDAVLELNEYKGNIKEGMDFLSNLESLKSD
ncbi:MAG TPA: phosphatidylinositol-specific phospholipase C domain-containing protein [Clostridia bacterium]|nr:MAG: 1-phosphatidylinositol phosphodiesterase precursor [Firmicutes bacterium ADurb.Bin146]HOD93443.1 phosphatidylinositol-specific phospholipase C domain-containing protein [Clostridia bacterium]HQM40126.1 phosphatidylinositol-specific phospholipase C domain-containing protein [Clostridia bacterium]